MRFKFFVRFSDIIAHTVKEFRNQNETDKTKRKPAKTFRDVIVWQKAHQFVLETYKYTKKLPKYELNGLSSQFRRAAVSISADII